MEIRNIAIIAHVDHGKTTLTDMLMKQTGTVPADFTMDTNAIEQERQITIYSKNASLVYPSAESGRVPTKINIVDTPGHADFGSEVERVLRSIDSVLLIVDSQEGPMPQTKFVLKKALELGLKPIVVINKIDKPAADVEATHEKLLELFIDLGATHDQLDFPIVYAIGREGKAKLNLTDEYSDLTPILDTILKYVPAAKADSAAPLRFQPFNLAYDNFLGRLGLGRIYDGTLKVGANVFVKKSNGEIRQAKITKLFLFKGMTREEVTEAQAGDIALLAGISDIYIGETICDSPNTEPLPAIKVDEPTISLNFLVNDSPFAGREGKYVTGRQIRERLERELEVNIGLKVDFDSENETSNSTAIVGKVYGRGELHISILLENMRREGYELQVSQPHVIFKENHGERSEPFEEAIIDVPEESSGVVIQKLR